MENFVTRNEFNGLGARVNKTEVQCGGIDRDVSTLKEDQEKQWDTIDTLRDCVHLLANKIYLILGVGLSLTFLLNLLSVAIAFFK